MSIRWRILIFLLMTTLPAASSAAERQAVLLEVEGVIGPAVSDYVVRNLAQAAREGAPLVVLQMDTPGGLDSAMRQIIRAIIDSPVPVATYVAPGGARAASAGTYILYASHVAAMAPATNLGAATPVQIATPLSSDKGDKQSGKGVEGGDAMTHKIINDAVAYIRGLARLRDRNGDWAEKAVREAASLPAEEALREGVIDLMAADLSELLQKMDGRSVKIQGQEQVLKTAGLTIERRAPDWRARLLAIISDPNVAYILMMIGIYGLIYEFANPGMILPGVAGAICVLLAMFAFQVLPINYAGLALILLGISFMLAEVFVPSFGALGIGGVIAFVIGSVILLDTDVPGYNIAWPLIGTFALTSAGFFMMMINMVIKARQQPVVSGAEELIGSIGEVMESFAKAGRVRVHSESWAARSSGPLEKGQQVRVTGREGLTLTVESLADSEKES